MVAPTAHQLAVLAAYAETGTYRDAAEKLGIARGTVRETLVRVRFRYGVSTSIQAYRAAVAAGDIAYRTPLPVDRP